MSGHNPRSPRSLWLTLVDVASVVAFSAVWLGLAAKLLSSASAPHLLVGLALAAPAGYLAADLASGLVHWFADSFFDEDAWLIGPLFIEPFREHHRDPQGIARHGFLEISGNNCLVTIAPLGAVWLWGTMDSPLGVFGAAFALCGALGVLATNQIHCWAHMPSDAVPKRVRRLQRLGFILSPEHHAQHHTGSNDCAYCVTSGWLNPLLDRFGVFERLTYWIRRARPGAHA